MKKTAILIVSAIILAACGGPEKPKKLIGKQDMENILYDMALLQSIKSFTPKTLDDNKVDARNYIYKKYKTDSLTLAQNHLYYAQDLKEYKKMQERVAGRINAEREKITGKKTDSLPAANPGSQPGKSITTAVTPPPTPQERQALQQRRDSTMGVAKRRMHQAPVNKISH